MMQVALISPYSQVQCIGLRILSACLKRAGFETRMIFLPDLRELMAATDYGARRLSPTALGQVVELCGDAGLVGISVMTASFYIARQLTEAIHAALNVPIIWGGIHPTVRPKECLQYADLACIGEGERAIVELARRIAEGRDYGDLNNLAQLDAQAHVVTNPLHPLEQNLDTLPFPDYDYTQHVVLHEGHLVPFTRPLMNYYLGDVGRWIDGPRYDVVTTRGCPYRCTFCGNDAMARIYPRWGRLRRRSPDNVIAEIQAVRARLPDLAGVTVHDDTFLANPESYIAEFSQLYQAQVGLPFRAYATPHAVDSIKLQHLVKAGLRVAMMGIQTGSPRTQALYNRHTSNEQIIRAARLIHTFRRHIPRPRYDLITDNPYETDDDRFETLRLIHRLPRPFRLSVYSLTFYPGTEIYNQAKADGLIEDDASRVYARNFNQVDANYYNLALMCHGWNLPRPLLYLSTRRPVFKFMSRDPMNKICGWLLNGLLALRLRRNQRLYNRYESQYLSQQQTNMNDRGDGR
jgi:anaerobic magnesium-protoporphyrin IX monomethyl ester cyclase